MQSWAEETIYHTSDLTIEAVLTGRTAEQVREQEEFERRNSAGARAAGAEFERIQEERRQAEEARRQAEAEKRRQEREARKALAEQLKEGRDAEQVRQDGHPHPGHDNGPPSQTPGAAQARETGRGGR